MKYSNCTPSHRHTKKTKNVVVWPDFDRKLVETELVENRQWKLLIDGQIACVWVTFNDPEIWEERIRMPQYTFIALQQTLTLEAIILLNSTNGKRICTKYRERFCSFRHLGQ
jgi:hypothetical protein